MDTERKQELKSSYRSRPVIGGVCRTLCSGNGRAWIQATKNVEALKNRFEFSIKIRSCPDPAMRAEWTKYGADSFSFTVLEELTKGEEQSDREFSDDLKALCEMWLEEPGAAGVDEGG